MKNKLFLLLFCFILCLLISPAYSQQSGGIPTGGTSSDASSIQGIGVTTVDPTRGQFMFYDTVSGALEYKNLPYIDVKDFGAICDGVNDDTSAIELAFATAPLFGAASNRFLFSGICRTDGSIDADVPANAVILIEGTWLLNSTFIFGQQARIIGIGGGTPVQFQNLPVGNIAPSATFPAGDILIQVDNNNAVKGMENIAITGVTGVGIGMYNGSQFYSNNVGIISDASSTEPPLVIDRFYLVRMVNTAVFPGNTAPTNAIYITNSDLTPDPHVLQSGLIVFQNLTFNRYGIYIGSHASTGQSIIAGIEFDNVLYEGPVDAAGTDSFMTLDGTFSNVYKIRLKDVEIADFIGPGLNIDTFFNIDGSEALISDVSYDYLVLDSALRSGIPLVSGGSINGLYLKGEQQRLNLGSQLQQQTNMLNRQGQAGQWLGAGQNFGPSVVPYAPFDVSQDPADWSAASGSATITAVADPIGGTMAGRCSSASGTQTKTIASVSTSLVTGDRLMFGVWIRASLQNSFATGVSSSPAVLATTGFAVNGTDPALLNAGNDNLQSNNSWSFIYTYGTVTTGAAGAVVVVLSCDDGNPIDFFAPFVVKIPAAAGARELDRVVRYLRNVPNGAPIGSVAMYPDSELWGGSISLETFLNSVSGSPSDGNAILYDSGGPGLEWGSGGGAPAGGDREVQFNNAGALGATSNVKIDTNNKFRISTALGINVSNFDDPILGSGSPVGFKATQADFTWSMLGLTGQGLIEFTDGTRIGIIVTNSTRGVGIGAYTNDAYTLVTNNLDRIIISNGGEVKVNSVAGDGTGKAVCIKSDGNLGTCTDVVGITGTCTCS